MLILFLAFFGLIAFARKTTLEALPAEIVVAYLPFLLVLAFPTLVHFPDAWAWTTTVAFFAFLTLPLTVKEAPTVGGVFGPFKVTLTPDLPVGAVSAAWLRLVGMMSVAEATTTIAFDITGSPTESPVAVRNTAPSDLVCAV